MRAAGIFPVALAYFSKVVSLFLICKRSCWSFVLGPWRRGDYVFLDFVAWEDEERYREPPQNIPKDCLKLASIYCRFCAFGQSWEYLGGELMGGFMYSLASGAVRALVGDLGYASTMTLRR